MTTWNLTGAKHHVLICYSTFHRTEFQPAYQTIGIRGYKQEGYRNGSLIAGYTHFHFGSCPEMVENWIKKCREFKENG